MGACSPAPSGSTAARSSSPTPTCTCSTAADDDDDWARALVPIYPASKDVSSWVIQKSVKLLLGAAGGLGDLVADPLPEEIRARHGLLSLAAALLDIHRPTTMRGRRARRRTG